ncbi:hypothetical protein A2U01_0061315, partial [Trifolium medium]|nr:hypothetical protein [Trifolium medium]
ARGVSMAAPGAVCMQSWSGASGRRARRRPLGARRARAAISAAASFFLHEREAEERKKLGFLGFFLQDSS